MFEAGFALVTFLWLGLETALLLREAAGLGSMTDRASALAIIGSVGLAGWAAVACALAGWGLLPGDGGRWLGLALMVGGLLLRGWAIATLGRWFTATVRLQAGQQVVRSGPYRLLRHPSYTGTFATLIGCGLALGTGLGASLLLLLPLPAYLYRMRVEECAMLAAFGIEYAAYQQTTRRILPWIW